MANPDFARCPKRSATCPAPSYCQPSCRHAQDWLRSLGAVVAAPRPEVDEDGFVTVHCTGERE